MVTIIQVEKDLGYPVVQVAVARGEMLEHLQVVLAPRVKVMRAGQVGVEVEVTAAAAVAAKALLETMQQVLQVETVVTEVCG
jgi:hypothetical protein